MEDFLKFIAGVMEVEPEKLSPQTAYNEFEKWDSIMHLKLVMETEEKYDVEIPIDKVPEIKTLNDLFSYTQK